MEYKVFHGVVAEVAEIVSDTKLSVIAIASDESIDSKLPFEVDLMATPAGIGTTNWTLVQFDNRMTIGTDEHDQPGLRGSVYIEHSHYGDLYNTYIKHGDSGVWPPPGIPLGACTSIVYSQATSNGALAGQRYHGFEVEIVNNHPPPRGSSSSSFEQARSWMSTLAMAIFSTRRPGMRTWVGHT